MPLPVAIRLKNSFTKFIEKLTHSTDKEATSFNPNMEPIEVVLERMGMPIEQWKFD